MIQRLWPVHHSHCGGVLFYTTVQCEPGDEVTYDIYVDGEGRRYDLGAQVVGTRVQNRCTRCGQVMQGTEDAYPGTERVDVDFSK